MRVTVRQLYTGEFISKFALLLDDNDVLMNAHIFLPIAFRYVFIDLDLTRDVDTSILFFFFFFYSSRLTEGISFPPFLLIAVYNSLSIGEREKSREREESIFKRI